MSFSVFNFGSKRFVIGCIPTFGGPTVSSEKNRDGRFSASVGLQEATGCSTGLLFVIVPACPGDVKLCKGLAVNIRIISQQGLWNTAQMPESTSYCLQSSSPNRKGHGKATIIPPGKPRGSHGFSMTPTVIFLDWNMERLFWETIRETHGKPP